MTSPWLWFTTRGAGVISLVLLSAVVCLGLLTRLRVRGEGWPGFLTAAVHQDLALVALFFLGLRLDDWGYPIVSSERVPDHLLEHARRAVATCPLLAIGLVEKGRSR